MGKTIVSQGKTTNEAIENGLKELNVKKDMVDIKILEEEDKKSFYSILAPRVVKVELTVKDNVKIEEKSEETREVKPRKVNENMEEIEAGVEGIKSFLDKFLEKEMNYTVEIKEFDIYVNIDGENLNYLIGYRGENLYAMQNILTAIAGKEIKERVRVILDIEGYKEKRQKTLEDLAEKVAKTVIRSGKPVKLEPMQAYERKIIHSKLQNNTKVETTSIGEEPYRRIVVSLKK